MSDAVLPGVSVMSVYLPRLRVQLEDWCRWTGSSWEKIQTVVGRSFRLLSSVVRDLCNLYCAALPSWLAAGIEEAAQRRLALKHRPMVAVGYGSGDAAEAWSIRAARGWTKAAERIQLQRAAQGAMDFTREQYESLHDGRDVRLDYVPRREFVISHVGKQYDATFQDLGIEYYNYVG